MKPVYRSSTGHYSESCIPASPEDSGHSGYDSTVSERRVCSSPEGLAPAQSVCFLHSVGQPCMLAYGGSSVVSLHQWFQHLGDLEELVKISGDTAADLQWWSVSGIQSQGKLLHPPPVATVITIPPF